MAVEDRQQLGNRVRKRFQLFLTPSDILDGGPKRTEDLEGGDKVRNRGDGQASADDVQDGAAGRHSM